MLLSFYTAHMHVLMNELHLRFQGSLMRGVARLHISISFVQLGYSVTVEVEPGSGLHP